LKKALIVIFLVLFFDQALKIYIKLTMTLGEELPIIGNWFKLYFTENYGMAFGMQFGGEWGKLSLSIFRLLAIMAIGVYLYIITRREKSTGLIISVSMILAGAMGNIIDSAFYGMLFTQSTYHTVAEFASAGQGYAGFLHGKVVDMLYFPIINLQHSELPAWIPDFLIGYDGRFVFFRPIFNLADSSITIGVFWLILFERKHLSL
jgi:signal peptidase II